METFWRVAVTVAGIGGISCFVFLSLYKEWIRLKAIEKLTKQQLFRLFATFLLLTFAFAVVGVVGFFYQRTVELQTEIDQARIRSDSESKRDKVLAHEYLAFLERRLDATRAYFEDRINEALREPPLPDPFQSLCR